MVCPWPTEELGAANSQASRGSGNRHCSLADISVGGRAVGFLCPFLVSKAFQTNMVKDQKAHGDSSHEGLGLE